MKNFNTNQHEPNEQETGILFKEECYSIYGCIYEVNRKLGTGFLEAVYQEALEIELKSKNVPLFVLLVWFVFNKSSYYCTKLFLFVETALTFYYF